VDSGASFHATGDLSKLQSYVKGSYGRVYLGDDKSCDIVGMGEVQLNLSNGTVLKLKEVRYVSSLRCSLISVGQLAENGMRTTFTNEAWKVTNGALVIAHGKKENILYVAVDNYGTVVMAS